MKNKNLKKNDGAKKEFTKPVCVLVDFCSESEIYFDETDPSGEITLPEDIL